MSISFKIQERSIGDMCRKVERLNRRAARLGLEGGWRVVGVEDAAAEMTSSGVYPMKRVTLEGSNYTNPAYPNTEFAGRKSVVDGGVTISAQSREVADLINASPHLCEHCGPDNRYRTEFLFVKFKGTLMQLGSSCVERVTGFSISGIPFVDFYNDLEEALARLGIEARKDSHGLRAVPVRGTLNALAAHVIERKGTSFGFRIGAVSTQEFEGFIPAVFARAFEAAGTGSVEALNIANALEHDVASLGTLRLLVDAARDEATDPCGVLSPLYEAPRFIGEVGDRVDLVVEITEVREIETQFGVTVLVKGVDAEGIEWSTFNSGAFGRVVGKGSARIKGTVKAHDAKWRTTTLTRVTMA